MSDSREKLTGWTVEDHLTFDITFALLRAPVRGLRRALTEDERRGIAVAVLEHLKLCGWEFYRPQNAVGHGAGRGRQRV
jgi:hypothetical protein